ncbi:MAG: hypothetical protein KIY11_02950 [Thermoplasmata archaeon]|nr:hypothetical protein [Candidatus Sysuiplasma acidicola]
MERYQLIAVIASFLLFVTMSIALVGPQWGSVGTLVPGTTELSKQMFNPGGYGITFLVLALLLVASMIGGVYLAKEE